MILVIIKKETNNTSNSKIQESISKGNRLNESWEDPNTGKEYIWNKGLFEKIDNWNKRNSHRGIKVSLKSKKTGALIELIVSYGAGEYLEGRIVNSPVTERLTKDMFQFYYSMYKGYEKLEDEFKRDFETYLLAAKQKRELYISDCFDYNEYKRKYNNSLS